MADSDTRALVRQLLEHTETLPESLQAHILARGAEAVEPLVEVLLDEPLADITAPGEGYAPIHAVQLLAQLKAPEAISAMVRRLMHSEPGEVLYDALLYALEELGPAVAPAALEALASARTEDERFGLLSVLARCEVQDERIYAALLAQLKEDPTAGAMNLSVYGDPRAIEPLTRVLEAHEVDEDTEDLFANQNIIELRGAIEELGGTLDEAQLDKVARARRSRHRLSTLFQNMLAETLPVAPARRAPRPGRNEPCWCGSGVKYKKCHLGEDAR
ncbi:SEC-C motif-containing protein [Archangium gephyra]|uniref:SEC-C motif domain protein n=1 Tax=Archangium gephyra TaxID=48 RepID=A0AAC8QJ14_9BACT|nr:SEC-C metal-binding domain-containing protein [Archangium gephyra]AKJ08389.1 SEC-C motif domain protein [Archangium gephyra]REG14293.1 SEC-C motif-containing protein [Archangium gephyra]